MRAAAYATGNHIVFGTGHYQPDTRAGQHLIAHELTHTVQQSGLQRQPLNDLQAIDNPALEREANAAADSVLAGRSVGNISQGTAQCVARVDESKATSGPTAEVESATLLDKVKKAASLASVKSVSEGKTSNGKRITVRLGEFKTGFAKGPTATTNAMLKKKAQAGSLYMSATVQNSSIGTIILEEAPKTDYYTTAWLSRYGYSNLRELGKDLTDARKSGALSGDGAIGAHIDKLAAAFSQGNLTTKLKDRKIDANADHIVEKQLHGQSVAENMQLLNAEENQNAGSWLNTKLVAIGNEILATLADDKIKALRIDFDSVTYEEGTAQDGIAKIREYLDAGNRSSAKPESAMEGTKTVLVAGGSSTTIHIKANKTDIAGNGTNNLARALVPTLTLENYQRPATGPAKTEKIEARINSERLPLIIPEAKNKSTLQINASETLEGPAAEGKAPAQALPSRTLTFPESSDYRFAFPGMSPGRFTKFWINEKGQLCAHGTITPTLKFLKEIKVALEGDHFGMVGDLGPENFKPPFQGMRVTEANLKLDLSPEFRPSGNFNFEIGPDKKPFVEGKVEASLDGGKFVAIGTLTGKNIPGVSAASGKVRYTIDEGWSGEVKASGSKLPGAKSTDVTFGFSTKGGVTQFYASGGIAFDIGSGRDLSIRADYQKSRMIYTGELDWQNPVKFVDRVKLGFSYDGETLKGVGAAPISFKKSSATFSGSLGVTYVRPMNGEAKLSGEGTLDVKSPKIDGSVTLHVNDRGEFWGTGKIGYQINDKLKPTIGIKLEKNGKVTLLGKIELTKAIELFPSKGGERELIKLNLDFIIPGPFPGLADPMAHVGAGVKVSYGIGPGQIVNTVIEGSFDPFEDDKNARLSFKSTLEIPAHVGVAGIIEAGLGIAVLGGFAAKAHGGLRIEPGFALNLTTRVPVEAVYESGDFSFSGRLAMEGGLVLGLGVKLYAHVEAAGGLAAKDFEHTLKNYQFDTGEKLKLNLAKLAYSTKTGVTWPNAGDISIEPKLISPVPMIKKIAESAKASLKG